MKNVKLTIGILCTALVTFQACKKDPAGNSGGGGNTPTTVSTGVGTGPGGSIVAGTDPSVATTQGFFLDNWKAKIFTTPTSQSLSKPSADASTTVVVDLSQITTKVSNYIFGNNSNPFMGQIVDQAPLMSHITALSPNIIRAPGGSLSDVYFFNADGSTTPAPSDAPSTLLDLNGTASAAGYWFGQNTQSWTLSIDNYYKMLQQTNSTGLITVNYGYARYGTSAHPDQVAAHLAADWVRYDKGRTTYWEVGNENYGNWEAGYRIDVSQNKDGQPAIINGTIYGTHFKVFADSMRAAAAEKGYNIKIGIVLTTTNDVANNAGVSNWNHDVLTAEGNSADFFVVHNYYTPYGQNSNPSIILSTPAPATSTMMTWVKTSAQNAGATLKPVVMDEWNIQAVGSSQQVSNIAGLHAVMTLGETLKNQISMASRWDLANGWNGGDDMGMFNIGDEPSVTKWNPRPAFYYMHYFEKYFGDRMVSSSVNGSSDIFSYGSTFSSGQAGVVLVNQGSTAQKVNIQFNNYAIGANYYYYELTGGSDNPPFSHNVIINGNGPASGQTGGPSNFDSIAAIAAPVAGGITVIVPAFGAVYLVADKK